MRDWRIRREFALVEKPAYRDRDIHLMEGYGQIDGFAAPLGQNLPHPVGSPPTRRESIYTVLSMVGFKYTA